MIRLLLNSLTPATCIHLIGRSCASLCALALLSTSVALAHDDGSHSHSSGQDLRITPRSADTHTTGTLPRALGESTSAKSLVSSEIRDGFRYITANGIPNHETGQFPNRGNPNVVSEQDYTFRIPLEPAPPSNLIHTTEAVVSDRGYLFGVAFNGVPFEPATGLNWTPEGLRRGGRPGEWVHEAIGGSINFGIDHANAHVQRTGAYHYHGIPTPLIHGDKPTLLGYAADGYPIYGSLGYQNPKSRNSRLVELQTSWQLKATKRPESPEGPGGQPDGRYTADWQYQQGSGDLDFLNARFAVTNEYPHGVYHYVITSAFPHIPRGFAGNPDPSFRRLPGQGPNHVTQRGERLSIGDQ